MANYSTNVMAFKEERKVCDGKKKRSEMGE